MPCPLAGVDQNRPRRFCIPDPKFDKSTPAQNAYIERFNRTYREEVLDAYLFDDLDEVRAITERWLEDYNTMRPHEALQDLPPRQFAQQQD